MTANLNLDSFRAMVGVNNYGEVRLNREGNLEKANNHFLQYNWGLGKQKISNSESQYIREMFMKAVANAGVDRLTMNNIRQKLGIAEKGDGDTSTAPLDRRTIAEVLDMVDKSKAVKVDDFNRKDVKTLNTYFDTVFGHKDSFADSKLSGRYTTNAGTYVPKHKQGVNVSEMRAVIKSWNSKHLGAKIDLSDDQLTVLFNRHGFQLRNSMVEKFLSAQNKARQADSSSIETMNYFNRNFRKAFGEELCREIRTILKTDDLKAGDSRLGLQGETRTEAEANAIRKAAGNRRSESGFKAANSTLFMSSTGITRFCDNYGQGKGDAIKNRNGKLSDDVLFTPEDFRLQTYAYDDLEAEEDVFRNTVDEECRVPMKMVIQRGDGTEHQTVAFEKTRQSKTTDREKLSQDAQYNNGVKSRNEFKLRGLLNEINDQVFGLADVNQKKVLLKAMGQKFVASVTKDIGLPDRDEDRKLVLKFNHDKTISATLYFKTKDAGKSMEFDFDILEHGDVERRYLGPQDKVEAAKAKAGAPQTAMKADDDLDLGFTGREKINEKDFTKLVDGWDD